MNEVWDDIRAMLRGELPAVLAEDTVYAAFPEAAALLPPPQRLTPFERLSQVLTGSIPDAEKLRSIQHHRWHLGRAPSHAHRLELINTSISRYTSPILVALLLAEARAAVHDSPATAGELAELAEAVALRLPAPGVPGAQALAVAYRGNAFRADARLQKARPFLDRAEALLQARPAHTWIHAEVASLRGSWLNDSRQLDDAARHHEYAIRHFEAAGDQIGSARALLNLAHRHSLAGQPEHAVSVTRQALRRLHPLTDARLVLFACHNLCFELAALGRGREAETLFRRLAPAYLRFSDRQTQLRRSWLEATIARATGDLDRAEATLRTTLKVFLEAALPFDAALTALELAALLLLDDRAVEVAAVVQPLPPLFVAEGVQREALAAVVLFHNAARRQQLDATLLARLRSFLERAQVDRAARFET